MTQGDFANSPIWDSWKRCGRLVVNGEFYLGALNQGRSR